MHDFHHHDHFLLGETVFGTELVVVQFKLNDDIFEFLMLFLCFIKLKLNPIVNSSTVNP